MFQKQNRTFDTKHTHLISADQNKFSINIPLIVVISNIKKYIRVRAKINNCYK